MFAIQIALFGLFAIVSDGFILDTTGERNVVQILTVGNGQVWGDFANPPQFCLNGTYATGFYLKIQDAHIVSDETGVNAIALTCMSVDRSETYGNVTSAVSSWGSWKPQSSCGNGQVLTRFQLKVQKGQLSDDDTAVDGVRFRCRDPAGGAESDLDGMNDVPFGTWGQWSTYCPEGSGICGLSTKVEPKQDIGSILRFDDTALNDALFYCCDD